MQGRPHRREGLFHCSSFSSMNLTGKTPSTGTIVRRWRGLIVLRACSLSPTARTISAPRTQTICQSPGFVSSIANIGIMIEMPIKRPAMKLPACQNLASGFFTIYSDPGNDGREPQASRCAAALIAKFKSAFAEAPGVSGCAGVDGLEAASGESCGRTIQFASRNRGPRDGLHELRLARNGLSDAATRGQ